MKHASQLTRAEPENGLKKSSASKPLR